MGKVGTLKWMNWLTDKSFPVGWVEQRVRGASPTEKTQHQPMFCWVTLSLFWYAGTALPNLRKNQGFRSFVSQTGS